MATAEAKKPTTTIAEVKILSGGTWQSSTAKRWGEVFNPSSGKVIAKVPLCGADDVDRAVQSAAAALPQWAATPVVDRARVMFRFRELIGKHFEELAALVTREHGKTLAEARASVQRGIEMVEFACGIPSLIMGQCLANIATNVDGETSRHPVGVCVGITPFNFPAWCRCGCFPWPSPAAIRSCSSRRRKCRSRRCGWASC